MKTDSLYEVAECIAEHLRLGELESFDIDVPIDDVTICSVIGRCEITFRSELLGQTIADAVIRVDELTMWLNDGDGTEIPCPFTCYELEHRIYKELVR